MTQISILRKWVLGGMVLSLVHASFAVAADSSIISHKDFEPKDATRDRVVPIRVYLPKQEAAQPVVLFSHGLGGSRENSKYLGEHWAAAGYVCVFMQHAGSDESVWKDAPLRERLKVLTKAASLESSNNRIQDVSFVIDQLEKWNSMEDHALHSRLDLEHIGMSGHSFGAVTTLAVAGRKFAFGKTYEEKRIDAFFAMSPQPGEMGNAQRTFGHLTSPILCMTGTKDDSPINKRVTPEFRREVYKALPDGDKYELVFEGGHHFTFSDVDGFRTRARDADHHPTIQKISLRFWDAYLKDDKAALDWLRSDQPQTDCKLKPSDIWQWK